MYGLGKSQREHAKNDLPYSMALEGDVEFREVKCT